jgi:hypothetical protein
MEFLIGFSIIYLFPAYCIYVIAKKFEVYDPWRAWIPIINLVVLCEIAVRPAWYVLLLFVPLVNLFIWASLWMDISGGLGRSRSLGILVAVPLVNFVVLGYLAFSTQPVDWQKP